MGLLRVHPRPASRGTAPSWRTAASPFRRALACTARGVPGPLHDQRRRQSDPRSGRRSPARYLSPLNHAMAWKGHEAAVAAAGSCWLWVSKPISQRWACGVRRTRQAYRRSKLAPSCGGLRPTLTRYRYRRRLRIVFIAEAPQDRHSGPPGGPLFRRRCRPSPHWSSPIGFCVRSMFARMSRYHAVSAVRGRYSASADCRYLASMLAQTCW